MSFVTLIVGSPVSGLSYCSFVSVAAPTGFLGSWSLLSVASPLGFSVRGVLSRSYSLAAFSALSA